MDFTSLFDVVIQLSVFALFVTSIIEVLKGISAIGIVGLLKGLYNTIIHNKMIESNGFPVLNFAVALLCCWAFNVTIMSKLFESVLFSQADLRPMQVAFARWIDYFGTASVVYAGSDQLFKRFLALKTQSDEVLLEVKKVTIPAGGESK